MFNKHNQITPQNNNNMNQMQKIPAYNPMPNPPFNVLKNFFFKHSLLIGNSAK